MVEQVELSTQTVQRPLGDVLPFDIDFTHPDITETFSFAILLFSASDDDSTDVAHANFGMGFVAPDTGATTEEQSACFAAQDALDISGAAATNTGQIHSISACVRIPAASGSFATVDVLAAFDSVQPGGVRIRFTVFPVLPAAIKVTAILFAGFARGYTDGVAGSTLSQNEDTGGTVNFEPTAVMFVASDGSLSSNNQHFSPNIGFALNDGGPSQVSAYVSTTDNIDPSDADGFLSTDRAFMCAPTRTAGSLDIDYDTVTAFIASGFSHIANAGTPDAHYLAFQASSRVRVAIANMPIAAATGLQAFNAFGFTPDVVVGMATLLTTLDSQVDGPTAAAAAYFVTGRKGSRAITARIKEGESTTTDASTRQEDVALLLYDHLGNVVQRATWQGGSGSGGFNLDFSVASQAGYMTVLGLQIIPSPPLPQRRRRVVRRARLAYRRPVRLVGGVPIGPIPLLPRTLRAIARQRRMARRRLLWRPRVVTTEVPEVGLAVEHPTGAVMSPGLLRGRVVGPGVASPEVDP